jgi:hypothetical protein
MRNLADTLPLVTLVASLIVIGLVALAPAVWGLIDVTRTPEATWVGAGRSKARWIVVFALGLWAWFVGLIALVVYLRRVRPRLREAQTAAGLTFPPAVTPRLKRVVIGLTGGYVVLSALGLWAYATHPHEEPFDPALARQANSICASTQAEVGSPPSYPPVPPSNSGRSEWIRLPMPTSGWNSGSALSAHLASTSALTTGLRRCSSSTSSAIGTPTPSEPAILRSIGLPVTAQTRPMPS